MNKVKHTRQDYITLAMNMLKSGGYSSEVAAALQYLETASKLPDVGEVCLGLIEWHRDACRDAGDKQGAAALQHAWKDCKKEVRG